MITNSDCEISIRKMCRMLQVDRKRIYRCKKQESAENLELMNHIDKIHTLEPTFGVLRMQDSLADLGYKVNVKRVRRLMRKMGIEAIYPRRNLTRLGLLQYRHPYLLRNKSVSRPNEAWAIDITYIPMKYGFMYLTAIIDLYSRCILGWQLSNSLAKETQTELLEQTIAEHGLPEIINSDQGSQYTCANWVEYLKGKGIQVSMCGKGRAIDNAIIERFFRSLKLDHVYLYPAANGIELFHGIEEFMTKYNHRSHQGIARRKPAEVYTHAA